MDYAIYYHGAEFGRINVEPDGLYYRLSALCPEPGPGLWRLWGCFGADSRCLGVLRPETGGMVLERRVSRHSWASGPDCFVLGRETEGFRPWRGTLEGQELPDAMLQSSGDGLRIAIFAPPGGPVPFAEYVEQMKELTLGGRDCLLLEWPPEEAAGDGALAPDQPADPQGGPSKAPDPTA